VPGPLRVCHLGKFYPPSRGGIETHVHTLLHAQVRQGLAPRLICMRHDVGPTVHEHDGPIPITRVGRRGTVAKLDYCPGLVTLLEGVEADLFHLHVPNPTMILGLLMAGRKLPIVVTYHSDHVKQWIRGLLFRPLERRFFNKVGAIAPTSPAYLEGSSLLAEYRSRVHPVPLGLDLSPYLQPSEQAQQRAREIQAKYPGPIWLALGRLVYYKGLHVAIAALQQTPGTLLIIGDGPERERLKEQAKSAGVGERVYFLGSVPDAEIAPHYLAATAFWFPSNARSEAFGLVQVEAMASGCPVINADIPHSGVPWVCRHEESGLTVPIEDPAALAAAAKRLLEEPGLRERLAAGGRTRAQADFDQDVMAARILEIYQSVLGRSKSPS